MVSKEINRTSPDINLANLRVNEARAYEGAVKSQEKYYSSATLQKLKEDIMNDFRHCFHLDMTLEVDTYIVTRAERIINDNFNDLGI